MRNKTLGINVRVTLEEKEKLIKNARYCGLGVSEYLRRLGLGKNVKAATDEKIYKAFRLVRQLKKDFDSLERSEILYRINTVGYSNACQSDAISECILSNLSNAIGNGNTCQAAAIIKCLISY